MLLFKPEHREPILTGRKTETRRVWERQRARVGAVHQARLALFGPPFAWLKVLDVRVEELEAIDEAGAWREGYENVTDFMAVFERINPGYAGAPVTVVRFELFGVPGEPSPTACWRCGSLDVQLEPLSVAGVIVDAGFRVCLACGRGWASTWPLG